MKTAIIGLGYVGLPLLLAYARKGHQALGIDIDPSKIEALLSGRSYIKHIPTSEVAEALASGNLDASSDFSRLADVDAVIICVPTPLDHHLEPDLSYVTDTLDAIVPHLSPGVTLSLESTTYPGTTEEEVLPRVAARGLVPGETV
ncbi:MAG: NAD(P)-binding domain-containing protein, partial [Verrucomicrobia bacterium]|nr:NAD(P)-binding domain-containing protein [Verrucomicrobiota bacterium]